jgi:hypothetical protein
MKDIHRNEKNAFPKAVKRKDRSNLLVSETPLFIDARERRSHFEAKNAQRVLSLCLRYGENYQWKTRCAHCRYLIRFLPRKRGG